MRVRNCLRAGIFAVLVFPSAYFLSISTAAAQTVEEASCYSEIDGRVAWNQAGAKVWNPQNIRMLCKGVKQVQVRINCFQSGISEHDDWQKAIADCVGVGNEVAQEQQLPAPGQQSSTSTVIEPPTSQMMENADDVPSPYPSPPPASTDSGFGPCRTCVFVMERIKQGTEMRMSSICDELATRDLEAFGMCIQTINASSSHVNSLRYWLFEGCYKYERYGTKTWMQPCPSDVICSVLRRRDAQPFCKPPPITNPFRDDY